MNKRIKIKKLTPAEMRKKEIEMLIMEDELINLVEKGAKRNPNCALIFHTNDRHE